MIQSRSSKIGQSIASQGWNKDNGHCSGGYPLLTAWLLCTSKQAVFDGVEAYITCFWTRIVLAV